MTEMTTFTLPADFVRLLIGVGHENRELLR